MTPSKKKVPKVPKKKTATKKKAAPKATTTKKKAAPKKTTKKAPVKKKSVQAKNPTADKPAKKAVQAQATQAPAQKVQKPVQEPAAAKHTGPRANAPLASNVAKKAQHKGYKGGNKGNTQYKGKGRPRRDATPKSDSPIKVEKVKMLNNYGPFRAGHVYPVQGQGRDWYQMGVYHVHASFATTDLDARVKVKERKKKEREERKEREPREQSFNPL